VSMPSLGTGNAHAAINPWGYQASSARSRRLNATRPARGSRHVRRYTPDTAERERQIAKRDVA
jgi:hypothetical protein